MASWQLQGGFEVDTRLVRLIQYDLWLHTRFNFRPFCETFIMLLVQSFNILPGESKLTPRKDNGHLDVGGRHITNLQKHGFINSKV